MKTTKLIIALIIALGTNQAFSQSNIYQVIRGIVVDRESHLPLPGASVSIESTNPPSGTSTDDKGNFRLEKVPLGRHMLRVSFMGYDPYVIRELLVESGKENVLTIELRESPVEIKDVIIKANSNKEQPLNTMAVLSARQLNMEEASRYAGGFDDPARLAAVFAGVAGNLGNNGIVVRGNAPKGMLWRMEGVEISNPTHFANITTFGGGGITALSSQMIANSDFFTGAFPAEYGNALSGVFDLKLKTGNNEKTEYSLQAGIIGLDFSAEGPFVKGRKASFVFNYRYSTFSLLGPLLPAEAGGIRYQDLCFKMNFPTAKAGNFSFWGIGALDVNPQLAKKDTTLWVYEQDREEAKNNLGMGALGLNHKITLGNKTYLFSSLSASGNSLDHSQQKLNRELSLLPQEKVIYNNWKYSFSTTVNHKFNARHTNRTGIIIDNLNYNYNIAQADGNGEALQQVVKEKNNRFLWQGFTQSKIELSPSISTVVGIHSQYFSMNAHYTLEPRIGITWHFLPKQSLGFGYGNHSQLEMLQVYLIRNYSGTQFSEPNKDLDFSKAHHFILSYSMTLSENLHFKIEPYYQCLYDIPVTPGSSFSLINLDKDWFVSDSLSGKGTGTNKGIDLTLERFLHDGYYYLITASLFDSRYKGGDGVEHNTRYNKNYVINVLGGREWTFKNSNMLSVNGKITYVGGDRISPLELQNSLIAKDAVYDETRAFADRKPSVFYVDFTINYKINRLRHSSTWSLKMINLLGVKEYYGYRYNFKKNTMEEDAESLVVPNFSYRFEF